MDYTPPKYPAAIPTITDLPDREDYKDWANVARYNEIKKELRAIMIELGTLPKGDFADVKTRLDDLLPHFHDRGDPATFDFETGAFTTDGNIHDLDLSAIVPAGAKAVMLWVMVVDDGVGNYLEFRKKGNVNAFNVAVVRMQVANVANDGALVIVCDENRKIQYRATNTVFTYIGTVIRGWWK